MLDFKVYLDEKAPKNPKPGDIWSTDGGFRGVNQSGNRQTFKDKEKTKAYVATKDTPKDEPKKDKKEPESEPTSKKEPSKPKLSDEEKTSLRTKDHEIADRQLAFNKQEMALEVQRVKDVESFSAELGQGAEKEIVGMLEVPAGTSVILPNEKLAGKGKKELEVMFNGETRDGKFYPKLSDIKRAVKQYREDKNLPTDGVGAGTPESRAGEVATHKALRMLAGGATEKEVETELMKSAGKGKALTASWVKAGIAAGKTVIDDIGLENIDEIVWDTPSGRELINAEGHGTSSDMFVTTKEGKRVGVSLKKDGKVFLANKGYSQEQAKLEKGLRDAGVSEEGIKKFNQETSPERYNQELVKAGTEVADSISKDDKTLSELETMLNPKSEADKKKLIKMFDQNNYKGVEKYIKQFGDSPITKDKIKEFLVKTKSQSGTGNHIKTLGKVTKNLSNKDYYRKIKSQDAEATKRLLGMMEDPTVRDGMKENIIEGMHAPSILGIDDNPNLDQFMTVYGIEPNGAQMNEETLSGLIPELGGDKGLMESISENYRAAKSPEEKEKVKKEIMDAFKKHIEVDMKEGASEGTINIVHDGPPVSKFPIFQTRMRSRPIGAAPVLEINQTNFMANALSKDDDGKQLGTDIDRWPSKKKKKYFDDEIKRLNSDLKAAEDDLEKEEIQRDIELYQKKKSEIKEQYQSLEGVISRMKRV